MSFEVRCVIAIISVVSHWSGLWQLNYTPTRTSTIRTRSQTRIENDLMTRSLRLSHSASPTRPASPGLRKSARLAARRGRSGPSGCDECDYSGILSGTGGDADGVFKCSRARRPRPSCHTSNGGGWHAVTDASGVWDIGRSLCDLVESVWVGRG